MSVAVRNLGLIDCQFGRQYDAYECPIQIFDKVFCYNLNSGPDHNSFSVTWLETLVCEGNQTTGVVGCGHRTNNIRRGYNLIIEVGGSDFQTTKSLLNKFQLPSEVEGYRCNNENFWKENTVAKVDLTIETSQSLIIQLSLFRYVNGAVVKKHQT